MRFSLELPRAFYEGMVKQARDELPLECCGLLAGSFVETATGERVGRVIEHYPLVNAAGSRVEFESDPRSMFAAVRDMDRRGLELLAVYHSHPTSEPVPSRKDRERNYSPDVMNLIVSFWSGKPEVRAWWLSADEAREARWYIQS